jgi:hypothetical protein
VCVFFVCFVTAFFCVSQQGGFKNTINNVMEKVHVKSPWPKKLRKKSLFPVVFSLRFFSYILYITFLAVSLHEEHENAVTSPLQQTLKQKSQKSQEKAGR